MYDPMRCHFTINAWWRVRRGQLPVKWTFCGWTGTRKTVGRVHRHPCSRPPWNRRSATGWWPARCWAYSIRSTGTGPGVWSPRASRTRPDVRLTVPAPSGPFPETPRPEPRGRQTTSPAPRGRGSREPTRTRTVLSCRRGCCWTGLGRLSPNRSSGCISSGRVSSFLTVYTWLEK